MIWWWLAACGGRSVAVPTGTFAVDPAFRGADPASPAASPALRLTLAAGSVTSSVDGVARPTRPHPAIRGCPRGMTADTLEAVTVPGPLTLGELVVQDAVLVPDCQGHDLWVTTDGDTAGPCTGPVCVRLVPSP